MKVRTSDDHVVDLPLDLLRSRSETIGNMVGDIDPDYDRSQDELIPSISIDSDAVNAYIKFVASGKIDDRLAIVAGADFFQDRKVIDDLTRRYADDEAFLKQIQSIYWDYNFNHLIASLQGPEIFSKLPTATMGKLRTEIQGLKIVPAIDLNIAMMALYGLVCKCIIFDRAGGEVKIITNPNISGDSFYIVASEIDYRITADITRIDDDMFLSPYLMTTQKSGLKTKAVFRDYNLEDYVQVAGRNYLIGNVLRSNGHHYYVRPDLELEKISNEVSIVRAYDVENNVALYRSIAEDSTLETSIGNIKIVAEEAIQSLDVGRAALMNGYVITPAVSRDGTNLRLFTPYLHSDGSFSIDAEAIVDRLSAMLGLSGLYLQFNYTSTTSVILKHDTGAVIMELIYLMKSPDIVKTVPCWLVPYNSQLNDGLKWDGIVLDPIRAAPKVWLHGIDPKRWPWEPDFWLPVQAMFHTSSAVAV